MNFILKPLPQKPKLIISDKVIKEIFYLHQQCGNTEWSGVLWGEVEGSITDIDNLKVKAIDFSLLDLGEPAYTEFELGLNVMDIYAEKPELMGNKLMTLHTHHSMKAFFSGTDMKQLEEQAPFHNYYISAIVNKDCDIIAKLAFVGTEKGNTLTYKDDEGKLISINDSTERNILFTCDFEIILPSDNTVKLKSLQEVKKQKTLEKQIGNFESSKSWIPYAHREEQLNLFDTEKPLKRFNVSNEEQFLVDLLGYAEDTLEESIKELETELPIVGKDLILDNIDEDIIPIYMEYCEFHQSKELDIQFYQKCCYIFDKYQCSLKNDILKLIKNKIIDDEQK